MPKYIKLFQSILTINLFRTRMFLFESFGFCCLLAFLTIVQLCGDHQTYLGGWAVWIVITTRTVKHTDNYKAISDETSGHKCLSGNLITCVWYRGGNQITSLV